jgi:hypothetical protein
MDEEDGNQTLAQSHMVVKDCQGLESRSPVWFSPRYTISPDPALIHDMTVN